MLSRLDAINSRLDDLVERFDAVEESLDDIKGLVTNTSRRKRNKYAIGSNGELMVLTKTVEGHPDQPFPGLDLPGELPKDAEGLKLMFSSHSSW